VPEGFEVLDDEAAADSEGIIEQGAPEFLTLGVAPSTIAD